jgi:hypothetical protein
LSWRSPAGMGPGTQHDGGHDRAYPAAGEQVGPPGPDQGGDGPGVVGGFGVQELDAAGQAAQAGRSGDGLDVPGGLLPAGGDQPRGGEVAQPSAEGIGGGDHEGVELALGVVVAWTAERRAASRTESAAR